ncbi:hypothetical protein [Bacillus pumilus]|uniref:hypothetical protein n=1 Tax=Bacillus pumilus TaxID=1408 RepID=UPI0015D548E0|nr:hypothetical protein [Bacillus pumilus]QLI77122.1 hypothetical protein HZ310_04565 [Bacillus pumilus]
MENGYFVIAGKIEGFDYKDAKVLRCDDEFDVESMINSLRSEGYTIFYVTKIVDRIDDNLTKEGAE